MVTKAEQLCGILAASYLSEPGLQDRARGAMLGLAVGTLLGLPVESSWYHEIDRRHPAGVSEIDPREARLPMDDDLAQAVDLGEVLIEGGDYISAFAERLVRWARENGRGMGFLTHRVIRLLEAGHMPPEAASSGLRGQPDCSQRGRDALRPCRLGQAWPAGDAGR